MLKNCKTIEELKKEYRRLAFIHHPDKGGDMETMKALNAEYDMMFAKLQKTSTNAKDHEADIDNFKDIIDQIINMEVNIELCGSWIWLSGDTKQYKDQIKAAGFWWARKKEMWYWHPEEKGARHSRGKYTMEEIRDKYGSQIIQNKKYTTITE